MEKKNELTAIDLALYLGCEVYVETPTASGTYHVRKGRFVGIRPVEKRRINPIIVDIETDSGGVIDMYFMPDQTKPILRPLSDMTEEEKNDPIWDSETTFSDFAGMVHCAAPVFAWLLARHFDLFGWIDAGLAIDKTKTNQ